ncbi:MAG: aldehyde dehydrogenase (NADP(+)) [Planctomycetaceae bacterium]|nr:aldehyde dehydrogenase (NADP(+)) [Planctomycetaceae bacterium]MCB9949713.1 aldehyde dehydrogenase (NADP(+)) [Planctomycetaceae bacterium]
MQQVLINGEWCNSIGTDGFSASNPATKTALELTFPVSPWEEIERAVQSAAAAAAIVRQWPGERFAAFLEAYADEIEKVAEAIIASANEETALPSEPRLKMEMGRATNQLRQAANAARSGSWAEPTIDTATNIRSMFGPIGPVVVFGPNNFPLAFNGISGGDFAAAVAAGNPVIAKGHSAHPRTTQLFAECAQRAATATDMPPGFVQLIYRTSHSDGAKLVSHPLIGASGYTGARHTGLVLKAAADQAGKPIYLELSSVNPVLMLPGALKERGEELAGEFSSSCLMGTGQFCTNPGLVLLVDGPDTELFIKAVAGKFSDAPVGTLLGEGVEKSLKSGIEALVDAGAEVVVGNAAADANRCCYGNTLLKVSGEAFLKNPAGLQAEAFGNASLFVVAKDGDELAAVISHLEGNLTGCVYSHTGGDDDALYDAVAPILRQKVGRLLNDKMPTGVAVSPAMNHGGPFPSTGHPGFTAVGIPASVKRFGMLQCYDNVRPHRLPPALQDKNPTGSMWRSVDGNWTQEEVGK